MGLGAVVLIPAAGIGAAMKANKMETSAYDPGIAYDPTRTGKIPEFGQFHRDQGMKYGIIENRFIRFKSIFNDGDSGLRKNTDVQPVLVGLVQVQSKIQQGYFALQTNPKSPPSLPTSLAKIWKELEIEVSR